MTRKASRKTIPHDVQIALLVACRRRCAMCFGLNRDTGQKQGQIAHIDDDPSNADADNLVFLCLQHHDEYDSRRSQSKGVTAGEIRYFREELIAAMAHAGRQPVQVGAVTVAPGDDYSGRWVRRDGGEDNAAELDIKALARDRLRVRGEALHGLRREFGPNIGVVEDFDGDIANDEVVIVQSHMSGLYTLTLRFDRGLLIATEQGVPPFGMGVFFGGIYERD